MSALVLGLALAAGVAAPLPVMLTVPEPARALPRLERSLAWLGRVLPELSPARLRRDLGPLGLDLFEPAGWRAAGLDAQKPLHVWLDPDAEVAALRLPVADPVAVERLLKRGLGGTPRARPVKDRSGYFSGETAATGFGVVHVEKGLWIQLSARPGAGVADSPLAALAGLLGAGGRRKAAAPPATGPIAWEDPRLAPLRLALRRTPPRRPPGAARARSEPPELWWSSAPTPEFEDARGAVWVKDDGLELVGDLVARGAAQAGLAELLRSESKARGLLRLDGGLRPAVELGVRLHRPGLEALARREGLPAGLGKVLEGSTQAVLTTRGDVIGVARLRPDAPEAAIEALMAALRARLPRGKVARLGEGELRSVVAWLGPLDAATLTKALAAGPSLPRALGLRASPALVLPALDARGAAGDGYMVPPVQRVAIELMASSLLRATRSLSLDVDTTTARSRVELRVVY